MKAVGTHAPLPIDHPEALLDLEIDKPVAGPRDLLVRIEAISVNPVDTKTRKTRPASPENPAILGWDAAGVVEAVGESVTLFKPGEAVYYAGDLTRPGTNAQFHLVDERLAALKPTSLDFAEAAALPLTTITAYEMLFDRLGVPRSSPEALGEVRSILIVGGAGGVGSIAIQLARRLTGLTVIATASRPETRDWVSAMGAHHVVDHRGDLAEQINALGVGPVGFIFSTTQTPSHFPALAKIIAPQGRIGMIDDGVGLDFSLLKTKSASLHWEFMYTRSMFHTEDMIAQHSLLSEVAGLIDDGTLRTTLTATDGPISAATLKAAHAAQESGTTIGKRVLVGF
ncbi:NADPH:quinone reductase [Rhodospirillum rubrum]|uniref:zinc-binding alcohol dehydrogenase family protein n=1 Tax=Rhodospirillum rubrum TaxID=1085 RepID=UPI0019056227|nr:zinc-binding alcohol dehydrogenase family protein [Rhodospirillum rubrum]MBK1665189.1 NADPH:quinone reductase [Rhodospirillum rubrum]MBK1677067.1 NADPH:quinone reductase [Rhodospirillum rubrum]